MTTTKKKDDDEGPVTVAEAERERRKERDEDKAAEKRAQEREERAEKVDARNNRTTEERLKDLERDVQNIQAILFDPQRHTTKIDSRSLAKDYVRKAVPEALEELSHIKALHILKTLHHPDFTDEERGRLQTALAQIINKAWFKGYSTALHWDKTTEADWIEANAQIEARAKAVPPRADARTVEEETRLRDERLRDEAREETRAEAHPAPVKTAPPSKS